MESTNTTLTEQSVLDVFNAVEYLTSGIDLDAYAMQMVAYDEQPTVAIVDAKASIKRGLPLLKTYKLVRGHSAPIDVPVAIPDGAVVHILHNARYEGTVQHHAVWALVAK